MANAGRILIIPKGAYNASTTYEMLDLVLHNGNSWLAKQTAVGIEPSDDASDYWHRCTDLDVVNNLTTGEAGHALDASQGKALKDALDEVASTAENAFTGARNADLAIKSMKAEYGVYFDGLMLHDLGTVSTTFVNGAAVLTLPVYRANYSPTQVRSVIVNGFGTGETFVCSIYDATPGSLTVSVQCVSNSALNGDCNLSLVAISV